MAKPNSKKQQDQSNRPKGDSLSYKVMIVGGFVVIVLTSGAFVLGKLQNTSLFSQSHSGLRFAVDAYGPRRLQNSKKQSIGQLGLRNKRGRSAGLMFTSISQSERLPMTAAEEAGLVKMREEEKLARDVYLTLAKQHDLPIFNRIAQAEQRHMDLVGLLLKKYQVKDPVQDDRVGQFSDQEVKQLYQDLVAKGSQSRKDALMVGATIEDMDIFDLDNLMKETKNSDIKLIYERLLWGSKNHMRAFSRNLTEMGVSYIPSYISQARYDQILSQDRRFYGRGRGRIYDR